MGNKLKEKGEGEIKDDRVFHQFLTYIYKPLLNLKGLFIKLFKTKFPAVQWLVYTSSQRSGFRALLGQNDAPQFLFHYLSLANLAIKCAQMNERSECEGND